MVLARLSISCAGFTIAALLAVRSSTEDRGKAPTFVDAGGGHPVLQIESTLRSGTTLFVGQELRFDVTVRAGRGRRVSLRLPAVPPGLVMSPLLAAPSPAVAEVRWHVARDEAGARTLVLEAWTDAVPAEHALLEIDLHVVGTTGFNRRMETGDVTGDGIADVVAAASQADVFGVPDCGAVYVWPGGSAPGAAPTATLVIPGPRTGDALGLDYLRLADVTGDGLLDIIVGAPYQKVGQVFRAGAVQIWAGSSGLAVPDSRPAPRASLVRSGLGEEAQLSFGSSQSIYLVDLDADGTRDIVVMAELADVLEVPDVGVVCVWMGGAGLTGTPTATGSLFVPGARPQDLLGFGGGGYSIVPGGIGPGPSGSDGALFGDVTGDGLLDIVVNASQADLDATDSGAIYVWEGSTGFSGQLAPSAILGFAGAADLDQLGVGNFTHAGQGMRLLDFDADGTLDVLALATGADVDGAPDAGALYFWSGGAGVSGRVEPTVRFTVPNAAAGDFLGFTAAVQLADVTGDTYPDLVAGSTVVDVWGVSDHGALYVFAGGPDAATRSAPCASLVGPSAAGGARIGSGPSGSRPGMGVLLEDVTADGIRDVVATAQGTDFGGATNAGAVFVWHGGTGLQGLRTADALLQRGAPAQNDELGWDTLYVADLSGDGVLDVVSVAAGANFPGAQDVGGIFVWEGGAQLLGPRSPYATLWSHDPGTVRLPNSKFSEGPSYQLADVTGDGRLDVIGSSPEAPGPAPGQGALYVWDGANLAGTPPPSAVLFDSASSVQMPNAPWGHGFLVADVTHDAVLDLVVVHSFLETPTGIPAGGVLVWAGGATLTGTPPAIRLQHSMPRSVDRLGKAAGNAVRTVDVTGDGLLDVVVAGSEIDRSFVLDVGAMLLTVGPVVPSVTSLLLSVPDAVAGDLLGD